MMHENTLQSKLFDHDNMKYLKKLLDELENVMDQVETELQRRVEETPGTRPHKRTLPTGTLELLKRISFHS